MLPLITNVLPNSLPPSGVSNTAQGIPLSTLSDAAAAARQQLPVAVSATGAPAAFSPEAPQWRQAQSDKKVTTIVSAQTTGVMDDAAAPVPPLANITLPAAPLPGSFFTSQPLQLGIPLTSQLTTQFIAQGADDEEVDLSPAVPQSSSNAGGDHSVATQVRDLRIARGDYSLPSVPSTLPVVARSNPVLPQIYAMGMPVPSSLTARIAKATAQAEWRTQPIPKKPGIAGAYGATAYGVAEARNHAAVSSTDATL